MFGYDRANTGLTSATGPKRELSTNWRFETGGQIVSSPAVVDQTLYIGSDDGNVYAIGITNGQEQWRFKTGENVQSSPAVINGQVIVGSDDGSLYALDAKNGKENWVFETGNSIVSSPVVADGTVYVGSYDNSIYALNATDGEQQWSVETGGTVTSSPANGDGRVYVGSADSKVYAVDTGGEVQWTFETDNGVSSSPAIGDGTIYVGSSDGRVYALDSESGQQQWSFAMSGLVGTSPAVAEGRVYVSEGLTGTRIHALDAATGERLWTGAAAASIRSSPSVADGVVYVGSSDGKVYAIDAAQGTPLWSFETGGGVRSSVAIMNRTLYVASKDKTVYAVSGKTTRKTATPTKRETPTASPSSTETPLMTPSDTPTPTRSPTVQSGTIFGGSSNLVPFVLGILGLGGGGALWFRRTRSETDDGGDAHTPTASIDDGSGGTASTDRDAVSADPMTEKGATSSDKSVDAEPTSTDAETVASDDEPPSKKTETETRSREKWNERLSSAFARMVPDEVPRAPSTDIEYDALREETPIGSGGNADVTRVVYPTSDGEVTIALKKPRISGTLHVDDIERMLAEAETWDKLDDHDHIVAVIDYGSDPLPWIAMEYMDGGDLTGYIGEMDVPQAVWTALAVTKGVRHAHRRGVAHLDLKPENVLFRSVEDAWNVPKVADWGLSKHLLDHSKSVEGLSPHYAAPEQFDEDFGPTDNITDIYQLGAVFYEMFTGQPPFTGSPTQVMRAVMDEEPTPPSELADVPPALDDILLTCLEKSRSERYDSLVYLRDALENLSRQ